MSIPSIPNGAQGREAINPKERVSADEDTKRDLLADMKRLMAGRPSNDYTHDHGITLYADRDDRDTINVTVFDPETHYNTDGNEELGVIVRTEFLSYPVWKDTAYRFSRGQNETYVSMGHTIRDESYALGLGDAPFPHIPQQYNGDPLTIGGVTHDAEQARLTRASQLSIAAEGVSRQVQQIGERANAEEQERDFGMHFFSQAEAERLQAQLETAAAQQ
jgi:hypothetical protein